MVSHSIALAKADLLSGIGRHEDAVRMLDHGIQSTQPKTAERGELLRRKVSILTHNLGRCWEAEAALQELKRDFP